LIKDLNIRPEALQESTRNMLELIGIGNDFLDRTQMAQQLREMIDKWDYMKFKNLCTTKEMIFAGYTSDKSLITRIYRELKKPNCPKIQCRNRQKTEQNFLKRRTPNLKNK
jgi:hypothetical protein